MKIDHQGETPPYEQVRVHYAHAISNRELPVGAKLPTVRALAKDLGLAVNTVARAYRDLESLGLIETRGRAGSIVTGDGVEQAARRAAHEYAEQLRALGLARDEAIDLVRRAFD